MTDSATEVDLSGIPDTPGYLTYINEAGVPEAVVDEVKSNRDIANAIEQWSRDMNAATRTGMPGIGDFSQHIMRERKGVFAQMSQCAWAVENDDILSTLADVVESLSFQKVRFELYDPEQQDIWNQWAKMVDLDTFMRQATRELFKVSQVYVGMWWEDVIMTVRKDRVGDTLNELEEEAEKERRRAAGQQEPEPEPKQGPGRGRYERPKKFALTLPSALTIFDPTKIVPVGPLLFGRERFAYVASRSEDEAFERVMKGEIPDSTVQQMIVSRYVPSGSERQEFESLGISHDKLWLMHPRAVFRHTLTRAHYERFAPVRLRSVLPVLEMKGHLRASDRASLVGNTNFIIVITKGSDKLPAKAAEIENLQEQAKVIARLPVLVGDHRQEVKIVAPVLDNTLIESRWEVLDSRLVFKALNTFQPTIQGGNSSSSIKEVSRVVARGLESRRHMLVRSMERHIFQSVMVENDGMISEFPSLEFSPRRISLDFSAEIISGVLKLRDRGDISRETTLEELDYDQDVEVLRRARETVRFDSVFNSQTPYSAPGTTPYGANSNVGPNGQSRTEGGRPPGVTEEGPRQTKV